MASTDLKQQFMALAKQIADKESAEDWSGAAELSLVLLEGCGEGLKKAEPQLAPHVDKYKEKCRFFVQQAKQHQNHQDINPEIMRLKKELISLATQISQAIICLGPFCICFFVAQIEFIQRAASSPVFS